MKKMRAFLHMTKAQVVRSSCHMKKMRVVLHVTKAQVVRSSSQKTKMRAVIIYVTKVQIVRMLTNSNLMKKMSSTLLDKGTSGNHTNKQADETDEGSSSRSHDKCE